MSVINDIGIAHILTDFCHSGNKDPFAHLHHRLSSDKKWKIIPAYEWKSNFRNWKFDCILLCLDRRSSLWRSTVTLCSLRTRGHWLPVFINLVFRKDSLYIFQIFAKFDTRINICMLQDQLFLWAKTEVIYGIEHDRTLCMISAIIWFWNSETAHRPQSHGPHGPL